MRNPLWLRDELILALDLYICAGRRQLDATDPLVVELSEVLRALPIYPPNVRTLDFRNPYGVSMKLGIFLAIDPEYAGKGLNRGSKLDKIVWEEFCVDWPYLALVANSIKAAIKNGDDVVEQSTNSNDEEVFLEGTLLTRLHKSRERDSRATKLKKQRAIETYGKIICEVCEFNFELFYGELGQGFAECHHKIPLARLETRTQTKLEDLAIVCANCHRMLHRTSFILSIEELRDIVLSIQT
jgi:5-methylcytosine-specific restriction enzyme A